MVDLNGLTSSIGGYITSLRLEKYFLNPSGLWALLAVVPLIIFYLIKPKPRDKVIPSLMFILTRDEKFLENTFFRKLLNDLLFFIQLLILIILGSAVAVPYTVTQHDVSTEDSVIVLDVSGSMRALSGGRERFEIAKIEARKLFTDKNTLIFASDIPELILKDGSRGDAEAVVSRASPRDTSTNLGDAIQFSADQLKEKKGRIIVISDFINSDTDPAAIKRVLESKDIKVDFVDVSGNADNIGIIDLKLEEQTSVVYVKNYKTVQEDVGISVAGVSKTLTLAPNSVESLSFTTPQGANKIELNVRDDFATDNTVYISTPSKTKTKVLFITNSDKKSNLYYALVANPKNEIELATPPIVPNVNHDVYVIQSVNKDLLLSETLRSISDSLKKGSILIIAGQDNLFDVNFRNLLPVEEKGPGGEGYVRVLQVNKFTRDIEFGKIKYYFDVKASPDTVVLAATDASNVTLIAFSSESGGKVVYYNIDDDASEFKTSLTYPLFWNNMIDALISRDSISTLNYKTGQTTAGTRLDTTGFFDFGGRTVAVNMLSDRESDVGRIGDLTKLGAESDKSRFKTSKQTALDDVLVTLALIFLFIEFIYIKVRGDL